MSERQIHNCGNVKEDNIRYIIPPVEIMEQEAGLTLRADVPGVAPEDIKVRVEDDVLTIEGPTRTGLPGETVFSEFHAPGFRRQFRLNNTVDADRISARLEQGVLTLQAPRPEKRGPRHITISSN